MREKDESPRERSGSAGGRGRGEKDAGFNDLRDRVSSLPESPSFPIWAKGKGAGAVNAAGVAMATGPV